ncbi:pyruvate dehydrogenase E2 component (dihydrolipoamide acetyltransferase) [Cyclonatronum proteinivorum]|uniref:Acetyltransferase component of pyruvate dehydrogenase complex n=1 Tax=Cyclonatronum proteinivorum TaxID=1457365 RepID=A0A345UKM7_9BACT|nr:pyruvate dehydrogenase complex dihydrolipoamide acetyltransferase [Cyclonatronum proteinivorum]AXJ01029.1 pyruvate dehydrogenase E2 component (dihydrolipoamide acetyltransferase) [Cyclonatronum proteinivorum]
MAIVIDMPKLSDTMEEGVIAKWNVSEGDAVSSGDIIAEVETDKATMDVEVFDDGTVLKLVASEGDAIPLGGIIAIIGDEGEDISDLLDGDSSSASGKEAPAKKEKEPKEVEEEEKEFDPLFGEIEDKDEAGQEESAESADSASDEDGRVKASPLARKMAKEQGISLSKVKGSGPNGRIVKADIEGYKPEEQSPKQQAKSEEKAAPATKPAAAAAVNYEDIPINQMRKTIARRLSESMFTNPHFYETIDIDMKKAVQMRESLNVMPDVKISFNDMVVKACAVALRRHPKINSSWLGDVIRMHKDVHIAVAVAVEDGLLTPVIRDTDRKGFAEIGKEVRELAGKAKEKKLQPDQMEGSTFTISNLGMFGIEEFTAIINPPNACILAVGAIRDVPVVENGEVVPGKRMKVTLSSDHRVVDGALAAQFLQTLRSLLEEPMGMLL